MTYDLSRLREMEKAATPGTLSIERLNDSSCATFYAICAGATPDSHGTVVMPIDWNDGYFPTVKDADAEYFVSLRNSAVAMLDLVDAAVRVASAQPSTREYLDALDGLRSAVSTFTPKDPRP